MLMLMMLIALSINHELKKTHAKREYEGFADKATTAISPLSNDLRREVKDEFDAWLSVPETRQVNATSPIDHR